MKPSEMGEALADILTQVCKRVFRDEPMTVSEYDNLADRVFLLCADERERLAAHEDLIERAEQALDARKEGL